MNQPLLDRLKAYRTDNPRAHLRDAARALDVTEADLIAARVGDGVTPLDDRYKDLYEALPKLGQIKAMVRSDLAVIERWGVFEQIDIQGTMGAVVGEEIDLRLFMHHWGQAFAVEEASPKGGTRYSLQVFDKSGVSVQKIYIEDEARLPEFHALVEAHRATTFAQTYEPEPARPTERPDGEIDVEGLRAAWDAMKDTHSFFPLLRKFGVTRTQALRLGGEGRAVKIAPRSLESALTQASKSKLPIMIFIGNRGIIEIHSGPVRRVERMAGWLNILDPRLNVHMKDESLASAWIVRKPTRDGVVTSVEYYDANAVEVAMLFGTRKPGTPEDPNWRGLVDALSAEHAAGKQS